MQPVQMFGAPGPMLSPQMTALNPLQRQAPSGGGGMLDPASLMKMFGGLMGGQRGGGYVDAGSQPMSNVG